MPMHGPNPCDGCGVQHTHVRSYITEDGRPVDHSGDPRRVFEATVRTVIGHGRPTRFITINVGDLLREQAFWGWFLDQTPDGGWADLATDGQLTLTFGHHPAEMRICVECGTTTDEYERLGRFMTDEG